MNKELKDAYIERAREFVQGNNATIHPSVERLIPAIAQLLEEREIDTNAQAMLRAICHSLEQDKERLEAINNDFTRTLCERIKGLEAEIAELKEELEGYKDQ